MSSIISHNEAETERLAALLAERLTHGDLVWLYGGLGAGKTAFVRGLAKGLGVTGSVTSPTYTLVNEYRGRLWLFHFDLYRLSGWDELWELGWDDYQNRGVCAVEWSERLEQPPVGYTVHLDTQGENRRTLRIRDPSGKDVLL